MAMSQKDQAKARVASARQALDDDVATLTERLPAASVIAGAGAAGGTGLALLGIVAKQVQNRLDQRSREKALTKEAEVQARAIAAAIAAAGLGGGGPPTRDDQDRQALEPAAQRPQVRMPVPAPRDGNDDGDGPPWGLLFLLAAAVAAVVAFVQGGQDDEDLWTSPDR